MAEKENNAWSNIINITQPSPPSKGFSLLRWLKWVAWLMLIFGAMKLLSLVAH